MRGAGTVCGVDQGIGLSPVEYRFALGGDGGKEVVTGAAVVAGELLEFTNATVAVGQHEVVAAAEQVVGLVHGDVRWALQQLIDRCALAHDVAARVRGEVYRAEYFGADESPQDVARVTAH